MQLVPEFNIEQHLLVFVIGDKSADASDKILTVLVAEVNPRSAGDDGFVLKNGKSIMVGTLDPSRQIIHVDGMDLKRK